MVPVDVQLSIPSPDSTISDRRVISVEPDDFQFLHRIPLRARESRPRSEQLSIPSPDSTCTIGDGVTSAHAAFNSFTGFHELIEREVAFRR